MNKGKLNGKVAVVTGASKGIGAAIAKEFADEGARVVINYASAKEDADRIVDEITKRGGQAVAVQANVAKKADVERLFSAAKRAFGKIDILVNNAGVYDWSPVEEITEEQFHRQFDVNAFGGMHRSVGVAARGGGVGFGIPRYSSVGARPLYRRPAYYNG